MRSYVLATAFVRLLAIVTQRSVDALCIAPVLRFVNVMLGAALLWVIYRTATTLRDRRRRLGRQTSSDDDDDDTIALRSLCDALCPVMFFYHFFYYTDTGASLLVLLAYEASLRNATKTSALVCATPSASVDDSSSRSVGRVERALSTDQHRLGCIRRRRCRARRLRGVLRDRRREAAA